jgi:CheY-like chemotaxis protein
VVTEGVLTAQGLELHKQPREETRAKGKEAAKRVAIVDDEEELTSIFSVLIRKLGYREEFVADDGNKIVQAVFEDGISPDLILMDYRMPEMNGLQAAEKILKAKPWIKIILTTADDSVKEEAEAAGVLYLQKPFAISALARMMKEVLGA